MLKQTGSLWLHCDPTMSHYLKLLLDAIFGASNFRNEIIWRRTGSKDLMKKRLPTNHDVILSCSVPTNHPGTSTQPSSLTTRMSSEKTAQKYRHRDAAGRLYRLDNLINPNSDRPQNLTYEFLGITKVWRWTRSGCKRRTTGDLSIRSTPGRVHTSSSGYLDEQRGLPMSDVWADIAPLNCKAAERLGYPTQKPVALLERILKPGNRARQCRARSILQVRRRLTRPSRWTGSGSGSTSPTSPWA